MVQFFFVKQEIVNHPMAVVHGVKVGVGINRKFTKPNCKCKKDAKWQNGKKHSQQLEENKVIMGPPF